MSFRRLFASLLLVIASLAAQASAGPDATQPAAEFAQLFDGRTGASCLALSEDGKTLFASFEAEGEVDAFNLKTWKTVGTMKCDGARYILCRGGQILVASYGHGKISCFDPTTYQLKNEVLTGSTNVDFLSAPWGSAFDGHVMAVHHSANITVYESKTFLVDLKADTHDQITRKYFPSWSLDGSIVLSQDSANLSPHGAQVNRWKNGLAEQVAADGDVESMLYQTKPGVYWYGATAIYAVGGASIDAVRSNFAKLLISDQSRGVFYGLGESDVTAYRESSTLDVIGLIPATYAHAGIAAPSAKKGKKPKKHDADAKADWPTDWRARENKFDHPMGITVDGVTYLFYINSKRSVMAAQMPALSDAAPAASVATPGSATPGSATPGSATQSAFPTSVRVGTPLATKLFPPAGTTLELINPPAGMKLSDDGTLTWTPLAADVGQHVVKLRATHGSDVSFERHELLVTSADGSALAVAKRGPDSVRESNAVTDLPNEGAGDGSGEDSSLWVSADGKAIMILAGNQLSRTDLSGRTIQIKVTLPRNYIRVAERSTYFVALSNNTLDVLDKNTLKPMRSFPLGSPKAYDLAIQPGTTTSFISIHSDNGGRETEELSHRVYQINEASGTMLPVADAVGQWVAVNPSGNRLYVGLHFMYQNGITLDFNIGEVLPSYGDVDALSTFAVGDGVPRRLGINIKAGVNGRGIRVAPDGGAVAYVSAAGNPEYSYAVPAFDPSDPRRTLASFSMKGHGFPADIAFHRALPWVAVITGDTVGIFDRVTGDSLDGKIDLGTAPVTDARRCIFSPDGLSLLVDVARQKSGRELVAFPLLLTDAERATAASTPLVPAPRQIDPPPRPDHPQGSADLKS